MPDWLFLALLPSTAALFTPLLWVMLPSRPRETDADSRMPAWIRTSSALAWLSSRAGKTGLVGVLICAGLLGWFFLGSRLGRLDTANNDLVASAQAAPGVLPPAAVPRAFSAAASADLAKPIFVDVTGRAGLNFLHQKN